MCFELADQRGGGRAAKGGEGSSGASSAMTMADLMSGYYQAQEMSTMVSALSRVVAEDDPWAAAEAYPWASGGAMGMEEQAMRGGGGGGYVHELGSFPSSEFAGNSQHTHAVGVASLVEEESFPCFAFGLRDLLLPHRASHASLFFSPVCILAFYSISKRGTRVGNLLGGKLIMP
jgi:hypothetical protein